MPELTRRRFLTTAGAAASAELAAEFRENGRQQYLPSWKDCWRTEGE